MTVFITGGTGRLGRALLDKLLGRQEIRVLDPGNALLPDGVIPIRGDLNDLKALSRGIQGADVVFHLAALVDYNAPWSRLEEINVQGTRNVVEICAKQRIRRLIFISSTSVYGKNLREIPANEETPTNPTDLYGKSKLEAERVVGEHFSDVPSTILRPGVLYGPTYLEYYSKVLRLIQHGKMRIIGDGKNIIPFVHAEDVADAMIKAAAFDVAKGKTYVLSGNTSLTQDEIYGIAAQALGVEFKKMYVNPNLAKIMLTLSSVFGESDISQEDINVLSSHRVFDTTRAENELRWKPIPLDAGIRQMVDLYKARILEAKKRKFLEYQREMLKKGKFVSIEAGRVIEMPHVEEEPTDADSKHGTQSFISAQPAEIQQAQQKPKYWQPMSSVADSSSQAQTAGILSQSESKREVAGPEAVAHKNVSRSLFGIVLPMGQKKEQADTTYKPEPGSEKYSNALSRMAPIVKPSKEPPKPPPSVLKYIQSQGSSTGQNQPAQIQGEQQQRQAQPQSQQTLRRNTGTVGSGRSWLDSVLKDIKKESEKKDKDT